MSQIPSPAEDVLRGAIHAMQELLQQMEANELPLGDSPLQREQKELRERTRAEIGSIIEMLQAAAKRIETAGLS